MSHPDETLGLAVRARTGDVTSVFGGNPALTIANDAVTNAKLSNMTQYTLKGNNVNATLDPSDLNVTQVLGLLGITQAGVLLDYQASSVSAAGATDVFRFLSNLGAVRNGYLSCQIHIIAVDNATGANGAVYQYWLGSTSNGTGGATLTQTFRAVRGTDPGVGANPFSLANDGGGGAVKLQFTKNAAIAQVNLLIAVNGVIQ